ncbi:hypothetical protein [Priestia megaterium]|uniref:hypothetical protein n=1 Tax=Priestia megaterium TaxID=1404 RepID=UPI002E1EA618|nr:hypothetical protein [Priestia megaterium]MED4274082.1 hypothetical protein [Priestia megaterium]MED4319406.1 hypothetical protein [Priestia megaterium]
MSRDEKENSNIKHVDLEYLMAMRMLSYRLLMVKQELKPKVKSSYRKQLKQEKPLQGGSVALFNS